MFAQPATKALMLLLDPLNVSPLVQYRVNRVLLSDPSPLGIHSVAAGLKVPNALFRGMRAALSPAVSLVVLQRQMCIAAGNTLRTDWFGAFEEATVTKLVHGRWAVGETSANSINLWGELVSRLYCFVNGPHALDGVVMASAAAFFSSEFALRVGSPTIVSVWEVIGMRGPSTTVGSVAWVLDELHKRVLNVSNWPPPFAAQRRACLALLEQAGVRSRPVLRARRLSRELTSNYDLKRTQGIQLNGSLLLDGSSPRQEYRSTAAAGAGVQCSGVRLPPGQEYRSTAAAWAGVQEYGRSGVREYGRRYSSHRASRFPKLPNYKCFDLDSHVPRPTWARRTTTSIRTHTEPQEPR